MKESNNGKKLNKKEAELAQRLAELTGDLQRVQADFVNYRRRADVERQGVINAAKATTIVQLLPVIDTIERAIAHVPESLTDDKWVQGIVALGKNLQKTLQELGLIRIDAAPGAVFDPNQHEAVAVEDGEGDEEFIGEELRAGYRLGENVVRPSMVKVTRQPTPPERKPAHVVEAQLKEEPHEKEKPED